MNPFTPFGLAVMHLFNSQSINFIIWENEPFHSHWGCSTVMICILIIVFNCLSLDMIVRLKKKKIEIFRQNNQHTVVFNVPRNLCR